MSSAEKDKDKQAQILELNPPVDLVFQGPFTNVVTSHLHLHNPTNNTIIFKVKTTAPRQYCVRPNSGVLGPMEESTISVMLQPFDPSSPDKNKHKFMVQTMFAPPDFKPEKLDEVWKAAPKSKLMDSKLRCVFVERGEAAPETESSSIAEEQPEPEQEKNEVEEVSALAPSPNNEEVAKAPTATNEQSTAGSTPAHPGARDKNVVEKETNESMLRDLQNKIDRLSTENSNLKSETNKLRQRLTATGAASSRQIKTSSSVVSQEQSSSPLSLIAVVLILVAIILGYLVGKWQ